MKGKVYCFSREPGGAEAVALAVKGQPLSSYMIIGKDYACKVFSSHGLSCEQYRGSSPEELSDYLDNFRKKVPVDAVLTSASSIPEQDMTEKYMWEWASKRKVPSIAILDQWQNYKERFSGPLGTEVCQYLPDVICAMDESARQGMIRDGIPAERIKIVGHPSLSRLRQIMTRTNNKDIAEARKKLKLKDTQKMILFVSEPFTDSYGDVAGYTELTILEEVLMYFQRRYSLANNKDRIHLVIKRHPKNSPDAFNRFKGNRLIPMIISDEIDKVPLLLASDLVIGMASIMLMESIALGRPTVSVQVGAKMKDLCEAVNQKIIPSISTHEEMTQLLDRLLDDSSYREQYIKDIKNYPIIHDADKRIWKLIESRRLQS